MQQHALLVAVAVAIALLVLATASGAAMSGSYTFSLVDPESGEDLAVVESTNGGDPRRLSSLPQTTVLELDLGNGTTVHRTLTRVTQPSFGVGATVVMGEGGVPTPLIPTAVTYRNEVPGSLAVITVDTETGFVDGLVENDDSTHTLHITRAFAGAALEVEKDEDMAAHECASLRAPSGDNSTRRLRELGDGHGDGDAHAHTHVIDPTSHSRILGFGGPTGSGSRRSLAVTRWTNCFTNDAQRRSFSIGIAIGSGLLQKQFQNDQSRLQNWLQGVVADTNLVYATQLNIRIEVVQLYIATGAESWDNPTCSKSIFDQLGTDNSSPGLTRWRPPSQQGLWHLLDDCFPGSGVIGLAYIGSLCEGRSNGGLSYNTGVSWYGRNTWLTFAHELGHNFNAQHTFQEGQGRTGGIMDYGDGLLNGEFQFNERYSKSEVCQEIQSNVNTCPYFALDSGETTTTAPRTTTASPNCYPTGTVLQFQGSSYSCAYCCTGQCSPTGGAPTGTNRVTCDAAIEPTTTLSPTTSIPTTVAPTTTMATTATPTTTAGPSSTTMPMCYPDSTVLQFQGSSYSCAYCCSGNCVPVDGAPEGSNWVQCQPSGAESSTAPPASTTTTTTSSATSTRAATTTTIATTTMAATTSTTTAPPMTTTTSSSGSCTPLNISGYYPVFLSEQCANVVSADGTSHAHDINGVTYFMPNGVDYTHGDDIMPMTTTTSSPMTTTSAETPAPPAETTTRGPAQAPSCEEQAFSTCREDLQGVSTWFRCVFKVYYECLDEGGKSLLEEAGQRFNGFSLAPGALFPFQGSFHNPRALGVRGLESA